MLFLPTHVHTYLCKCTGLGLVYQRAGIRPESAGNGISYKGKVVPLETQLLWTLDWGLGQEEEERERERGNPKPKKRKKKKKKERQIKFFFFFVFCRVPPPPLPESSQASTWDLGGGGAREKNIKNKNNSLFFFFFIFLGFGFWFLSLSLPLFLCLSVKPSGNCRQTEYSAAFGTSGMIDGLVWSINEMVDFSYMLSPFRTAFSRTLAFMSID